jgi:predicted dienelactone hydrolase
MRSKLRVVLLAVVALAATGVLGRATASPRADEQSIELAGLRTSVWSDPGIAGALPVLVFSHGFHGCATQSRFLMSAFAEAGYLVLAPNHRDAACDGGTAGWFDPSTQPFDHPEAWSDAVYRDRADDIRSVVDALAHDERLQRRADLHRLGLVGHSLGGYTVLGLAGAWPTWRLDGVLAVLALSPYAQPFMKQRTLVHLSAPVMFQGGTWDFGITPFLTAPDGAFDQSPSPKYYVEFEHASHFAWTDLPGLHHEAIARYSVAFMNRYVKSQPADPILLQDQRVVAEH